MSKPSIQNITTTQTFQNWLDKTNEMVDIMRDSALTASVSGDITSGDATLVGKFTANTVVVFDELKTNNIVSRTSGEPVLFGNQVRVVATGQDALAAIFEYGASGARTRYTDGNSAWDVGYDNKIDQNFLINHVGSGIQFKLAPSGVLTIPSLITSTDMIVGTNLTVEENLDVKGNLTANTATFVSANGSFNGTFAGNFTGDIFHPAGNKILENGGPAANIPAVFTGNVTGTVSSLTNHNTDSLTERATNPTNLYFTTARARGAFSAGTGINIVDGSIALNIPTVRSSLSAGSNITYNANTGSISVAAAYTTAINNAIAAGSAVRGYIIFNGATGAVIKSKNATVTKFGTGFYGIICPASIRDGTNNWAVLLGNVDVGVKSRAAAAGRPSSQLDVYTTFIDGQSTVGFNVNATRRTNTAVSRAYGGNDNDNTQLFGITAVDPTYVSLIIL